MSTFPTRFYTEDGESAGSIHGPLPLYKGMRITVHGYERQYEVLHWEFHIGHPDEDHGLRVIVRDRGPYKSYPPTPPPADEPFLP